MRSSELWPFTNRCLCHWISKFNASACYIICASWPTPLGYKSELIHAYIEAQKEGRFVNYSSGTPYIAVNKYFYTKCTLNLLFIFILLRIPASISAASWKRWRAAAAVSEGAPVATTTLPHVVATTTSLVDFVPASSLDLSLLFHHVYDFVGYSEVLYRAAANVALGHPPELVAVSWRADHLSQVDVHPIVARYQVSVVRFSILQLYQHRVVLRGS